LERATQKCPNCILKKGGVDILRSVAVYDDGAKRLVLPFKHSGKLRVSRFLSATLTGCLLSVPSSGSIVPFAGEGVPRSGGVVVKKFPSKVEGCPALPGGVVGAYPNSTLLLPVPLSYIRQFRRGYNQAAVLARLVGRSTGIPVVYDAVRRAHRPDQGHKNEAERRKNLSGVFTITKPEIITGKRVIVIDDVVTSGATLDELSKTLRRAGAKEIIAISFARVLRQT
jgi:predicted amidophosphoribosyltransferase